MKKVNKYHVPDYKKRERVAYLRDNLVTQKNGTKKQMGFTEIGQSFDPPISRQATMKLYEKYHQEKRQAEEEAMGGA